VRLITRNDTSLAVALMVGAIVVFQQPLHFLLDVARDVEVRYHLDLLPALTIMTGVFIFHEYRKRQLANAESRARATEAAQARRRSAELERLMTFSQALANALDDSTLQQVLWRYLPAFTGERDFWVLRRRIDRWEALLQDTTRVKRSMEVLEAIADRALAGGAFWDCLEPIRDTEPVCFPMFAGGEVVGMVGTHDGATLTHDDRKALGAATALIAIAMRTVQLFKDTTDHSIRDALTGCFTRGHGLEILDQELRRARRSGLPLSVVMFDIDQFKTINDELGHVRGDEVLRAVGEQLARVLRGTDICCRYGGDEFLIILPETHIAGAEHVAENLRREIATLTISAGERTIGVTVSVGVTAAAPGEMEATTLIDRTDDALYRAKRAGRNRFCVRVPPESAAAEPPAKVRSGSIRLAG
jgi:diguanylate cyclase (GGDEF)-like protein